MAPEQRTEKKRVLIFWTGNSATSQMAEGLLRHDAGEYFEVESAGTRPGAVRPEAIAVLREVGIDIRGHRSKHIDEVGGLQFDFIITVDDNARASCPIFFGHGQKLPHYRSLGAVVTSGSRLNVQFFTSGGVTPSSPG